MHSYPGDRSSFGRDDTVVRQWSGREARALRDAKRMSIREFAAHLGVHERLISKWEAGGIGCIPVPSIRLPSIHLLPGPTMWCGHGSRI